jgi:branched-chain amino acid transport system permease protein
VGGAILTSFSQIYDPGSYHPINHTFIIWVMVIVGGAGNNFGALFGGLFIYLIWVMSEPVSQALFTTISEWSASIGWGAIPDIGSRSLQMRVFVLGLLIVLTLRFAPRGLIPELVVPDARRDRPAKKEEPRSD